VYIDFLKEDYLDKNTDEREGYIKRDKIHLGKIIEERIKSDIDSIVDRWWELDNIGYISNDEKYLELLKEAEQLYCFAYYTSCIALIGIATEEFSKYLSYENKINNYKLDQNDRLLELKKRKIISSDIYNEFDSIRKLRNLCIHYNGKFKKLDEITLKAKAKEALNHYKAGIKQLSKMECPNIDEVTEKFISNNKLSFEEFKLRQRNINKQEKGIDLQISPSKKTLIFNGNYYIGEIDIETDFFKEMTLFDLNRSSVLVLDLTLPDVELVKKLKLKKGNVILASIIANVSTLGQTEEWKLLSIDDVFYGEYQL
jgi:hypothetical protein